MAHIQNLMTNTFIMSNPPKSEAPVLGQGQIEILAGQTVEVDDDDWDKLKNAQVIQAYLDTDRIRVVKKEQDFVAPTVESSGDAKPDKYPHLMESGHAETEDGKVKHEVKSIETAAPKDNQVLNAPSGKRRGSG